MTAPTVADPFGAPKAFSGQVGPALRCIGERLVAIVPKAIYRQERNPFYDARKPESYSNSPLRDRMICDLILVNGPAFMYGGNPQKSIPDTQGPFPSPGVIFDYEIVKSSIVNAIEDHQVGGGVVLGYLYKTPTKNDNTVWNFGRHPEAGTPERNLAIQVYEAYRNGQLPTHTLTPAQPLADPIRPNMHNPAAYGQQAMPMGGQVAPIQGQQWPQGQGFTQQAHPGQFTAGPQGQIGLSAAGQAVAQQAQLGQFMPPAAPVSAPAAEQIPPAPPGLEAVWGMFTPEQRQQALAMQPNAQPTY